MDIYKNPSIYKNGLSEDDLNKLVTLSNGIDFDIIGKLSSYVQDIPQSRLYVKYNPIIGLININGFFNLVTPASGGSSIKLYDFNTDLPIFTIGGINRGFIHADSSCICQSLGNYKNAIIKYRPCQTGTYKREPPRNNARRPNDLPTAGFCRGQNKIVPGLTLRYG